MSNNKLTNEPNPWQLKSSQLIYENKWIALREDRVVDPNGNDTIYGVLSPKSLAVGVIPLDENNNTWLVGQFRYPLNEYSWEIIEGGCPIGTDLLDSAKRELKEEAGLEATEWKHFLTLHTSNCITDETAEVYVARNITIGESQPDEDEKLQILQLPFEEAYQYVLEGKITDGISVAAILKLKVMLMKGDI